MAAGGKSGGQYLESSVHGIAEGASALTEHEVYSANLELIKDIFGAGAVSENVNGKI